MMRSPGPALTCCAPPRPRGGVTGSRNTTAPGLPATFDREPLELGLHAIADERDLVALVVRVGEQERQQVLVDELARCPREDLDAVERPPVSGTTTSPDRRRGRRPEARRWGTASGSTPSAAQPAARLLAEEPLGSSSHSRSSPLTLNTSTRMLAAPSPTMPECSRAVSMRRKNSANDVFVATPLIPLIDMCPPLRPSKKSRSTWTGRSSRPMPVARGVPSGRRRAPCPVHHPRLARRARRGRGRPRSRGRPCDVDLGGSDLGRRHDAELGDAMGVGLVARPLVDGLGLGDDAVRADLAGLRHLGAHHHQIVELQEVAVVEHDAERAGGGMLGAEDAPDLFAHDARSRVRTRDGFAQGPIHEAPVAHAVAELASRGRRWAPGSAVPAGRRGAPTPPSGSKAAVRSAIVAACSFGSCPDVSHRTMPVHECPPSSIGEAHVPGVALVVGDAEHRGSLSRGELSHDGVAVGFQVRDPMALHVADRGVGGEVVQGPSATTKHEAASAVARTPSARRILVCNSIMSSARVLGRARGGGDAGFQIDRGHLLVATAGEHRPPFDAHRLDRRSTRRAIPHRGSDRERADQSGCGPRHRVVQGEPGVDPTDAVDERHPVDAVIGALERFPIVAFDAWGRPNLRRGPASRPDRAGCRSPGPSPRRRSAPWRVSYPCTRTVPTVAPARRRCPPA